ncbi:HAD family hydrolase [Clostridium beijerinckii]|jgi:haloacid dehalogenase superfamily, subfamily IA, variant 1 with third motif having Dx(3-4)D or Dx(3-4)E|uniref:HAD family hydrolase n=2 Tax=Clostridium beijerinckii TaxID=1520 RepID=A0A1S8RTK4_CLOBE|nr:HAD family hydrolase [Clostridium beijerinckii]ABR34846.1 HAD-superfamily hydrolase, subfamily IA, variant 1 [Clostridium beijerinckii NCIMB 8052]AIU04330.1 HAD family hydrolase [Clostridium beijerinckii ATCC 35702]MBF7810521.1 HAD family hydrolase [Clostridium beijerinckii]MCI1580924.1 HAD family hydrolase [Clostridium beijerinckii]MCI1624398.1 HAD family hydrolase [Clostridium beijerinckii]
MIFFDIDDTLLDHKSSELLGVESFYEEYKHYFKLEKEMFYKLWCQISDKYFSSYLKKEMTFEQQRIERMKALFRYSNIKLRDEDANIKFKKYLINYEKNWKPYNDVVPCLKYLSRKYELGIISNGDLNQQLLKLEKINIKQYFSNILTAGEVGISKPNIELFNIACNRANRQPQECCYIGDNLYTDIIPCERIGMNGIWLNRRGETIIVNNIKTISNLNDLKSIFNKKI